MDWNKVDELVAGGYISVRKHPTAGLFIYNYTQKAQWDGHWTPETKACRGLITDGNRKIVARPFAKFFNIEQHDSLPNEAFDVYEKLDGSLGIIYHLHGKPQVATRGSFDSPQAQEANKILAEKYGHINFDPSLTYLVEILYPENRIVVNYGQRRELVLLAVIDTATGYELNDIDQLECVVYGKLPVVQWSPGKHGVDGLAYLRGMEKPNEEGFVIRFQSGLRVKLKFAEYKRLHKILTGVNERHIWEHLRAGTFDAMIERVPDEFMSWAKSVADVLLERYEAVVSTCKADFKVLDSRKDTALYFKTRKYPSILFAMLDERDWMDMAWRVVEPPPGTTFKVEEC